MKKLTLVIFCFSFVFACKNDKLKEKNENNKILNHKNKIAVIPVDTSYKQNVKLFEDYYYLMPKNLIDIIHNTEIVLAYKGNEFTFLKGYVIKEGLLV